MTAHPAGYSRAAGIALVVAAVAGAASEPPGAALGGPWTRSKGQTTVRLRSTLCEACGAREGTEFSHRIAASRGGTWAPSNGVRADRRCHGWLEDHPTWAGEGGWHIRRDRRDPLEVPVFLVTVLQPLGAWCLLADDGSWEEVYPDDYGLPEVPPHLPPGHVRLVLGRPLGTVPWVDPR